MHFARALAAGSSFALRALVLDHGLLPALNEGLLEVHRLVNQDANRVGRSK